MLKKFGMVSVGITAGLLAVAPMASATEGHDGGQHGTGNIECSNEGDGVTNDVENDGMLAVGQITGPLASGNTGNVLSCNSILNDNLNDLSINVASEEIVNNDSDD